MSFCCVTGAEKRSLGAEKRKSGAEKRKSGAEKRKSGAEKRKSGAEKRKSGAEKRNCTLGPPYYYTYLYLTDFSVTETDKCSALPNFEKSVTD